MKFFEFVDFSKLVQKYRKTNKKSILTNKNDFSDKSMQENYNKIFFIFFLMENFSMEIFLREEKNSPRE